MVNGYMGKILTVDLSNKKVEFESPDDSLYADFMGGYGLGARILFSRQKGGIDPLAAESILGFVTGTLTGTPAFFGLRFMVVGKSPLTNTWGDANSGGDFGPHLKFAGYDAVFITGISEKPAYLFIDNGKAELRDARHLWGKDAYDVEDVLQRELGSDIRVACIGQAGEKLSRISGVITNKGRAAARSGLGCLMGSKRLKAVAVRGNQEVPVADRPRVMALNKQYAEFSNQVIAGVMQKFGTCGLTTWSVKTGDAPVKNWGGVGVEDFPDAAPISDQAVINLQDKKYGCWHCPIRCGGHMKAGAGEYQYVANVHKPEYETLVSFGSLCLNNNLESIIKLNDICNRYGIDTISAGGTIAFAIECYVNGIISSQDTGGIELTWGNHKAIVTMMEKMADREGFGDLLADGVKLAAERLGDRAREFAIHIGGQEPPMHDPKEGAHYATTYYVEATPGRHTQGHEGLRNIPGSEIPKFDRKSYAGRGKAHKAGVCYNHVLSSAGVCLIGYMCMDAGALAQYLSAVRLTAT